MICESTPETILLPIGGKRFLPNNCFSYSNACNLAFSSANLAFVFAICKF
jgi:hypothetical protein